MATILNIPARQITVGQSIFGPMKPAAGLAGARMSLDITEFNNVAGAQFGVDLESSEDVGASWKLMGGSHPTSPLLRRGVRQDTLDVDYNFGNTAQGPILSTDNTRVRAVVTSTVAFQSSGGTLTVY
jgi:hypothetical protein